MINSSPTCCVKGVSRRAAVAVPRKTRRHSTRPVGVLESLVRPRQSLESGSEHVESLLSEEGRCLLVTPDGYKLYVRDPGQHRDWDLRWESMPAWSPFHGVAWAGVLRSSYQFSPCYLELRAPDGQLSMLPLMEARSLFLGRRGVALPFSDACPPLCAVPAHSELLLQGALELARRRRWRYLELRGGALVAPGRQASINYHEHVLDLRQDEHTLFSGFKQEFRTAIRKAQRSGLQVEIGTRPELVREFFRMHCSTRQRQGMPIQPFAFFGNIQRHILDRQSGVVVIVRRGEKPVAGAIFLHSASSAVFKFGASDPGWLQFRPNNLVMWAAIRWYLQQGATSLYMGRTSLSNEGLRRFKLGWGTVERTLSYYRINPSEGKQMEAIDRSSTWVSNVFQRLPVRALRLIGGLFYPQFD